MSDSTSKHTDPLVASVTDRQRVTRLLAAIHALIDQDTYA